MFPSRDISYLVIGGHQTLPLPLPRFPPQQWLETESQSVSQRKILKHLLLWARIAACLHCSFVFDPECPQQRQIRRHNSYNRTAASTNDWPHVVTTKGCYPLMLSFKCQWPIFVKEDTSTPLKVDAPSCSKCFCQNAFSQNSSWELHSAFWWIKTWLVVPACVAHFSSDCDFLLIEIVRI